MRGVTSGFHIANTQSGNRSTDNQRGMREKNREHSGKNVANVKFTRYDVLVGTYIESSGTHVTNVALEARAVS